MACAIAVPPAIRVGRRFGWVAAPRDDRWHRVATPQTGGLAILLGTAVGWMALAKAGDGSLTIGAGADPFPIWPGALLMFALGIVDDFRGVSPAGKILWQVVAALPLAILGPRLPVAETAWIALPVTVLWLVGITNAFNLLDNMDGLAGGVVVVTATGIAACAGISGAPAAGAPAIVLGGAVAGFLFFNLPPARAFMGDSGSLMVGFALAALCLRLPPSAAAAPAAWCLVPLALMAVPILDTTLVTVGRIRRRRSPFRGGRDHASHRLALLGLPEGAVALALCGVAAVWVLLAVAWHADRSPAALAALAVAALASVGFAARLYRVTRATVEEGEASPAGRAPTRPRAPGVAVPTSRIAWDLELEAPGRRRD